MEGRPAQTETCVSVPHLRAPSVWRVSPSCCMPDSSLPPQRLKSDVWGAGFGVESEGSAGWLLASGAVRGSEGLLLRPLRHGLTVPLCLPL